MGGDVREGTWAMDKMNGHGKCVLGDGRTYVGDWLDGEKHGSGKYTWPTGDVYEVSAACLYTCSGSV